MTVIMRPIEVKCHSFITAIAEPPYIDNEPPKRHNGFFWFARRPRLFGKTTPFLFANLLEQRL